MFIDAQVPAFKAAGAVSLVLAVIVITILFPVCAVPFIAV
jgi:hypothetical protein